MGKVYDSITADISAWVASQPMFFVGSAPLSPRGHVNVSPKGLDTLRILGPHRVAYLDLTGSGAETIAHVRENGRIVLMFCAFCGPPKIVRFHGTAGLVSPADAGWNALRSHFPDYLGARAIVEVDVARVSDSCGYGVPQLEGVSQRQALEGWTRTKGEALPAYRREKNTRSIDGLPALDAS